MKRIALFAGSFDPFTRGHEDIVLRGLKVFDEIVIAIGYNSQKSSRYFAIEMMISFGLEMFSFKIPEMIIAIRFLFREEGHE